MNKPGNFQPAANIGMHLCNNCTFTFMHIYVFVCVLSEAIIYFPRWRVSVCVFVQPSNQKRRSKLLHKE